MSKINNYQARNIAQAVAFKAFVPDLKAAAIAAVKAVYLAQQATFAKHGISVSIMDSYLIPSRAFSEMARGNDICFSYLQDDQQDDHLVSLVHILEQEEFKALPPLYQNVRNGYNYVVHLSDEETAKDAIAALKHYNLQRGPMHNFAHELASQLDGKTVLSAMKVLPEIADIISKYTGTKLTPQNPITVPLEALIKKYMQPALPAPTPIERKKIKLVKKEAA